MSSSNRVRRSTHLLVVLSLAAYAVVARHDPAAAQSDLAVTGAPVEHTVFAKVECHNEEIVSIEDNGDVWVYWHTQLPWPGPFYEGNDDLVALWFSAANTRFADIDGDRCDDIISIGDNGDVTVYWNLWWREPDWPIYRGTHARSVALGFAAANTQFADIDGDGQDEIVTIGDNGDVTAYENMCCSAGWPVYDGRWSRVVAQGGFRPSNTRFADINGDDFDEIITVGDNGDVRAYENLGGSWSQSPVYDGSRSRIVARGGFRPANTRFADLTGDGREEIMTISNNGDIWAFLNVLGSYDGNASSLVAQGFRR